MNLRRLAHRAHTDDRGAGYLAAFLVLFSVVSVLGVGILVDSARYFSNWRQIGSIALEAARAGANALDAQHARTSGSHVVDPSRAQAAAADAAAAFVSGSGMSLDSVTVADNKVTARVSRQVNSWFPLMPSRTVSQQASATLEARGP